MAPPADGRSTAGRRVVSLGDLMTDVVAQLAGPVRHGDDAPARVTTLGGGAAANAAAWLASLDVPSAFVGRAGADAWGQAAVLLLAESGVDARVARDPDYPTGTCLVLVEGDGERTMISDAGASAMLSPDDLPGDLFRPDDLLFVSGFTFAHPVARNAALAALRRGAQAQMVRALDPGSVAAIEAAGAPAVRDWLHGVDCLLPNEDEACALAGCADPLEAARQLVDGVREVVVKLGPGGALWTDGDSVVQVPAEPVPVVDTTGAGDSFAAGFLAARTRGADPEASLRQGALVAAQCVQVVGGRPA